MSSFAFLQPLPCLSGSSNASRSVKCTRRPPRAGLAPPTLPLPREEDDMKFNVSALSMADLEVRARDLPAARIHFEAHLVNNPTDADAWLSWARAEDKLERRKGGAERVLSRAIASNIDDERIWMLWAKMALKLHGYEEAKMIYKSALLACSTSSALLSSFAILEADTNGVAVARSLFQKALSYQKNNIKTYIAWASREERAGNFEQARGIFSDAIKVVDLEDKSSMSVLYTAFASLEARSRNTSQARFLYMRASESNPKDIVVWQSWGCFEAKLGNGTRARELFERGVIVDPFYASIWQAWAMLESKSGNVNQARTLFKRGIRADSSDAATWHAWGQLEAKEGNRNYAKELFENGINAIGHKKKGTPLFLSLAKLQNISDARTTLKKALDRPFERPSDRAKLLHAWAQIETPEKAKQLYTESLNIFPHDIITLYSLALLEIHHLNDLVHARSLLRRAMRINSDDARTIIALAGLEWTHFEKDGGVQRAKELFEKAANRTSKNKTFLRAYANFEQAKGDPQLATRLRILAERTR